MNLYLYLEGFYMFSINFIQWGMSHFMAQRNGNGLRPLLSHRKVKSLVYLTPWRTTHYMARKGGYMYFTMM